MAEVRLTNGDVAIVDDADLPLVSVFKWGLITSRGGPRYAKATTLADGKNLFMHRLILGVHGAEAGVDHLNRDGLDNRRQNLRIATRSQNNQNRSLPKLSGLPRGVGMKGRLFRARIRVNRQLLHLGLFRTAEHAAEAYRCAALRYYGPHARLES